jgi:Uma2 family endonuclease
MSTATHQKRSPQSEFIVLHDISWKTYEGILDALGEYHIRHTYDEGMLEMRRILYGVTWEDYLKLLAATPDLNLPHTYDEGTLEMMSPRKDHDWVATLVARMIEAYALASDTPIQSIGSTTLQAATGGRGLQPDEAYYLAHEPLVRCKATYEPDKDPPPDLVIEVDVTSSSLPRMPVFAKIGVPEIWRNARGRLRFYRLNAEGEYEITDRSVAFPFLKAADLMRFVKRRSEIGENGTVREFIKWALAAKLRQSN